MGGKEVGAVVDLNQPFKPWTAGTMMEEKDVGYLISSTTLPGRTKTQGSNCPTAVNRASCDVAAVHSLSLRSLACRTDFLYTLEGTNRVRSGYLLTIKKIQLCSLDWRRLRLQFLNLSYARLAGLTLTYPQEAGSVTTLRI
jgi:hypothetical protein